VGLAEAQLGIRYGRKRSDLCFHVSRIEKIVGIEEVHELASRGKHPGIPRSANAAVGLSDQLNPTAEGRKPGRSVLGGAVVNDNDFNCRVPLI
jgi:hypothetical protein